MSKRKITLAVIIAFISLAVIEAANAQAENFSRLTFRLETPKSTYLLLEPIPLKTTIENRTGQRIYGWADSGRVGETFKVYLQTPGGEVKTPSNLEGVESCSNCKNTKFIEPDASFEKTHLIQEYFVETFFSEVGDYKIWAELCNKHCDGKDIISAPSNAITIAVVKPDKKDFPAFQMMREIVKTKYSPKGGYKTTMLMREDFVSKYQDTPYTNYSLYELANYYKHRRNYVKTQYYLFRITSDFVFSEDVRKQRLEVEKAIQENTQNR